MVTGKKAFEGKSQVLLISAIATSEPPPVSRVQPAAPPALDHVVKTCLAKDPADRWQDARDLLAELQWIAEGGEDAGFSVSPAAGAARAPMAAPGRARRRRWCSSRRWRCRPICTSRARPNPRNCASASRATSPRSRLKRRPERRLGSRTFSATDSAISPDGRTIVFRARPTTTDTWFLYLRPVGAVAPQQLAGTEDAPAAVLVGRQPIGRVSSRGGKLKRVRRVGRRAAGHLRRRRVLGRRRGTATARSSSAPPRDSSSCPRTAERRRRSRRSATARADTSGRASCPTDATTCIWPSPARPQHAARSFAGRARLEGPDAGRRGRIQRGVHRRRRAGRSSGYLLFLRDSAVFAQPFNTEDAGACPANPRASRAT